jgi:hypothetical protein
MIQPGPLRVRVNDELVLDAGTCQEVSGPQSVERVIRPPATTLFRQVVAYLREKPDPPRPLSGSLVGREGVAAAALVLRWGSYLSVLLDRAKPIWREVASETASRISDDEMARINIEASAALAEWIDLYREDLGRDYARLVDRAVYCLPMPKKTSRLKVTEFAAPADPEFAAAIVGAAPATLLERASSDVARAPTRVLSNALVNSAWRNGPVEDIHAGESEGYPLDRRRITPAEERTLMAFASERLALGMTICLRLEMERPRRAWRDQVLPYALAGGLLITPSGWSLTEASREVRLPGG